MTGKARILALRLEDGQLSEVNAFYRAEGKCACGKKMEPDEPRALLGQPFSSWAMPVNIGIFKVQAMCAPCFKKFLRFRRRVGWTK